ncbi:MAG: hypothetical protein IKS10_08570 [Lachnospiraceae bacterium]|nr:hypothetical protein [Lachnospiraceae bacterium]
MKKFLAWIVVLGFVLGFCGTNVRTQAAETAVSGAARFEVPYVSTYYFNPKPTTNDTIQIPLYITDYAQSEYMKNDSSVKLDLIYAVDGVKKTIKGVPLGDYTLTLGKLSAGTHTFYVEVYDPRTGLTSHRLFNDLWVVNPSETTITEKQTYYMTKADLTKYGIRNDNSTDENALISTKDGLTQLFADKQAAGYKKIVLLKGTYRINGEDARKTCIKIPSHFTVDMNGSTFKLDTIKTEGIYVSGCIVTMDDVVDAHLINGTLEGDRFERQARDLEINGQGEGINAFYMSGGKYNSLENLTIKCTTGHTVFTTGTWDGPGAILDTFTRTAIVNGKEVADKNCSTSSMIDLTRMLAYDADEDVVYVGHPGGYRGLNGDSPVIYLSFYDANKKFMESFTGFQYRKIVVPTGAKYIRVTFSGTDFPTDDPDMHSVYVYTKHLGEYYKFSGIRFEDTRTCALAPASGGNVLIENCTFNRCGNSITPCPVDFEDGWEEMQDVYYRNNTVLAKAEHTTATVIDNTGYNHVYENCKAHDIVIRSRVYGCVIRDFSSGDSTILWALGTKMTNLYGRIQNIVGGHINFYNPLTEQEVPVQMKVKNCTIANGDNVTTYTNSVVDTVVYENCTFTNFSGDNATLHGCTVMMDGDVRSHLHFYDCTFVPVAGKDLIYFNFSNPYYVDRVFENCKFTAKVATNPFSKDLTFKGCEFEDLYLTASVGDHPEKITFEDCVIRSASDKMLEFGPYAYSLDHIDVTFKNCDITLTGKSLIYMLAKTTAGSRVLFDSCVIRSNDGVLVDGWAVDDRAYLDIVLRNTQISKSLVPSKNIKSNNVKVIVEEVSTPYVTIWSGSTGQPEAAAGEIVKITADATGTGTLKYQWQSRKNASAAWSNSGQSGAKTATLSVATSAGLHGWQFRCVVTDGSGRKAYSKEVTMTILPRITTQPVNQTVAVGDTVKYQVVAAGKTALKYQWQSRKDASSAWTNSGQSGAKTSTLLVATSAGLHGWQFRCVVTDADGHKAFSNVVTVSLVPKITKQPTAASVKAGAKVTLSVAATGRATLKYQWQSRRNSSAEWTNSGQTGAKTANLTVATLAGLNGWQFRCVIMDGNGQKTVSNVVTLSVK